MRCVVVCFYFLANWSMSSQFFFLERMIPCITYFDPQCLAPLAASFYFRQLNRVVHHGTVCIFFIRISLIRQLLGFSLCISFKYLFNLICRSTQKGPQQSVQVFGRKVPTWCWSITFYSINYCSILAFALTNFEKRFKVISAIFIIKRFVKWSMKSS